MGANIYKNKKPLFLFLVPAFAFMAIFLYYPFIQNILNSFKQITELGAASKGWNDPWYTNYVTMFQDENMRVAVRNTILMMVVTIIGQVGIAIVLALLVDNISHGAKFFRTVYFFPIVISATALGLMFNLIFLYDKGMVNQLLESLGVTELIDWKGEKLALITMMLPVMWQYVGFYFVIFLTGIANIPADIYESAMLDGIRPLQKAAYITIPMLRSVLTSSIVLVISGCFKVFDIIFMVTNGGPLDSSQLLSTYMYQKAFARGNGGYASSIAIVMIVLGVAVTSVLRKLLSGGEENE